VLVVLLRFLIEMEKESTSHFEMLFTRYRQFFIGRKLSTVDAKTFLLTFQAAAFYSKGRLSIKQKFSCEKLD
jgi:hypothetical protein